MLSGYLQALTATYPQLTYDPFHCGLELLAHYQHVERRDFFDILFLDIEMGASHGIDLALEIRKIAPETIIIYITSYKKYMYDSFKRAEAFDFLLKPVSQADFDQVLKEAYAKLHARDDVLIFHDKRELTRVPKQDILYIEVLTYARKLLVHTKSDVYERRGRANEIYKTLNHDFFIMIHSSYIVNMDYIRKLSFELVCLENKQNLPVSKRRGREVREAYTQFLHRRVRA